MEDVDGDWENMEEKVTQIAKDIIETKKISGGKNRKTIWWTEVKKAVKQKC